MDEDISSSSWNFQHSAAEPNPDRLSELPEALLLQIISQLPMADAVRTGALSTKWKGLWKHVDEITVHHPIHKSGNDYPFAPYDVMAREFVSTVNRTLLQYTRGRIKRFSLLVDYVYDIDHQVLDEWFRWVYLRKVEILILKIPMSVYCAPEWFCHNLFLEKLEIEGPADVKFCSNVVNWASLKSLSLSSVDISDEDIAKVLLGCRVLENLVLNHISGIGNLNVVSSTLKMLRVVDKQRDDKALFQVNAPWLEHLEVSGSYRGAVLQLKDVSSLLKGSFTFECIDHFYRQFDVDLFLAREAPILASLCHVEELEFGRELIQVLSVLKLLGKPCPSFKCKHLTLYSRAFKHELPGIVYLLHNSPFLETLVIEVEAPTNWEDNVAKYLKGVCEFDGATYLSIQNADFPCLKSMKISRNFYLCSHRDAWCNVHQFDSEIAAHVTRYAHFLEKVIITSPLKEEMNYNCSKNCVSQYFSLLSHGFFHFSFDGSKVGEWELSKKESTSEIVYSKVNSYRRTQNLLYAMEGQYGTLVS